MVCRASSGDCRGPADPPRAGDRRVGQQRPHERGDRAAVAPQHPHRRQPSRTRLRQAGGGQPNRTRGRHARRTHAVRAGTASRRRSGLRRPDRAHTAPRRPARPGRQHRADRVRRDGYRRCGQDDAGRPLGAPRRRAVSGRAALRRPARLPPVRRSAPGRRRDPRLSHRARRSGRPDSVRPARRSPRCIARRWPGDGSWFCWTTRTTPIRSGRCCPVRPARSCW